MYRNFVLTFTLVAALLISTSMLFAQSYQVSDKLSIRAVISTVEKGDIDAVWSKGGEESTAGGDKVIWGHFYASPSDVNWGSQNNPDLYVKIWFDRSGRIDVNFFHVSVPEIKVYSEYNSSSQNSTCTMENRYYRHEYWVNSSSTDTQYDIADYFPLTAGYEWTYSTSSVNEDSGQLESYHTKRKCGGTDIFNSKSVIPIGYMYSYDGGKTYDTWSTADFNYFTLDSSGLLMHGANDISDSGEDDIFVLNPSVTVASKSFKVGDSWTTSIAQANASAYFEILAAGDTVTVTAGTYTDTIKLYESTDTSQRYIWLAKGVGIVKVESLHDSDAGILAMGDAELLSKNF